MFKLNDSTTSATRDLEVPLLGTEHEDENNYYQQKRSSDEETVASSDCGRSISDDDEDESEDEDSCETGCTMTCTFHTDDDDDDNKRESCRNCVFDHWIIWFVLPLLLFLQFGMAFTVSEHHGDVSPHNNLIQLDWATVSYSIVLFMMASYLYRRAINGRYGCDSVVLQLLPEIVMDVVLGLVLFHYVIYGFLVMVTSTCVMALYSAMSSCRLFVGYETREDDPSHVKAIDDHYIAVV